MCARFKLKSVPSDFIVEEITPDKEILAQDKLYSFDKNSKGKFLHFIIWKENRDTLELLDEIARKLHAPREVLSIAGMKDKSAITAQMASAYNIKKEQLDKITLRGTKLMPLRYSDKKVFLGNLWGNMFTITARAISETPDIIRRNLELRASEMQGRFPNYFGEQRFGEDNSTQKIGKLILASDFKTAASECAKRYRECAAYLKKHPKNYLGAIRQLPIKLQKMFIHAVQSEIFNSALDEFIARKITDDGIDIPLPGYRFSSRIFTSETDKIVEEILRKEKISPKDFDVRELPGVSSEGEVRRAFENFFDFLIISVGGDEINPGKTKVVLQFSLPKAAYATVFLDALFLAKES